MAEQVQELLEGYPLVLRMKPAIAVTDDQLFEFCRLNRGLLIERTREGDIVIMTPTGGRTSDRNAELTMQLRTWSKREGSGVVFDAAGGFCLPNGAMRSPDGAWVRRSRLAILTSEQKERFLPLCPDFVIELRSPSDDLADLQSKMAEYLDNDAQLGWLIDPLESCVHVYRPGVEIERLDRPARLSGDPILSGFTLDLAPIWEPGF